MYIDDILIATDTVESNLETLRETLIKLKEHGFELNVKKCQFLKKEIEYLEYMVSQKGITLSERHTSAIAEFPRPQNVHELQRFLGLTGYFRKFIADYAGTAKPLHNLLKKTVEFDFSDECVRAFDSLKSKLITYPVLRLYNPHAETQLHTDASANGIAAILLQKQGDSSWALIAFFSRATNKAEANYHSYELEMLAIVKAIERFHMYLYGLDFTVVSDCSAVVYAVNRANLNPRIARWTLKLQAYKFKLIHRAGDKMSYVDALSRQVGYIGSLPLERELEYRQLEDAKWREIAVELELKDNDRFELIDGLVFRKGEIGPRFVVPDSIKQTSGNKRHPCAS